MCNRYRNDPESMQSLPTWRDYISWSDDSLSGEPATEVFPKYRGMVIRAEDGKRIADTMAWGVPLTVPGKRPGTTIKKRVTNVRNLTSSFWRSMLVKPAQRCLVPFTIFAEPKIGEGRENHWFLVPGVDASAFAGIWRASDEGNVYAILTCEQNPFSRTAAPKGDARHSSSRRL